MVKIDSLNLCMPGVSKEEARAMGQNVAERVARSLPERTKNTHLGAVFLRVRVPVGTPRDEIEKLVALSILEKLG